MRITWLFLLPVTALLVGGERRLCGASPETETERKLGDRFGGRLVVAQRSEVRSLNPFTALDAVSREAIGLLNSDLIHVNRQSLKPEP